MGEIKIIEKFEVGKTYDCYGDKFTVYGFSVFPNEIAG